MYQISYYHFGETGTRRVQPHHKNLESHEEAIRLLNQEQDNCLQAGFQVSEIQNDSFTRIEPNTQKKTIFQIEKI